MKFSQLFLTLLTTSLSIFSSSIYCADWTNYVENVPWITFSEPPQWTGEKILALTFDDGPSNNTTNTNLILDILEQYNYPATFFQSFMYADPTSPNVVAVMKRMHSNPLFTVGDHTVAHVDLATQSPVDRMNALEGVRQVENNIANQVGGNITTLMRAPYGSPYLDYWNGGSAILTEVAQQVMDMGFISIGWHLDTSDYTCAVLYPKDPVSCVINNSFSLINAGGYGIILFHDIYDHTRIALPQFLDHAKSLGYTFTTVESLIKAKYGKSSAELVGNNYKTYKPATSTEAPVNPSSSPSSSTPQSRTGKPTQWSDDGSSTSPPPATGSPAPTPIPASSTKPTSAPTSSPTTTKSPSSTPVSPTPSPTKSSSPSPTPSATSTSHIDAVTKSSASSKSVSVVSVLFALLASFVMLS